MSTIESNGQIEYVIREVFHRLKDILETSFFIICLAIGILVFSVLYLLKPLYRFRTTAPGTQVRSCPCLQANLSNKKSHTVNPNLKDTNSEINPRNIKGNDGIKFNFNSNIDKQPDNVGTKDSCQGSSKYEIDEDFLREIGFDECCKLPQSKETGEQIDDE